MYAVECSKCVVSGYGAPRDMQAENAQKRNNKCHAILVDSARIIKYAATKLTTAKAANKVV